MECYLFHHNRLFCNYRVLNPKWNTSLISLHGSGNIAEEGMERMKELERLGRIAVNGSSGHAMAFILINSRADVVICRDLYKAHSSLPCMCELIPGHIP